MPPLYWKETSCSFPGRSSLKAISSPRFKKAMVCNRSRTVRATNSVPSEAKMSVSGQNVTEVPEVRVRAGVSPVTESLLFTLPPSTNSIPWRLPLRSISRINRLDRALTTDTPTPCKPPDTLYPSPPNFPPACRTVRTTSAALLPLCSPDGYGSTGIPRPLSSTRHPPSANKVTEILVQ